MKPRSLRAGIHAIEMVFAMAVLGACLFPIVDLLQRGHHTGHLDEFHVLARRRLGLLQASFEMVPYTQLRDAAQKGRTPSKEIQGVPEGAQELPPSFLPILSPQGPKPQALRAYFREFEPGLGEITVWAMWFDPKAKKTKQVTDSRFVSDPIHWESP